MKKNNWSIYASIGSVPFSNGNGFFNEAMIFFVISEHELLCFTDTNEIFTIERKHLRSSATIFYKFLRRGK